MTDAISPTYWRLANIIVVCTILTKKIMMEFIHRLYSENVRVGNSVRIVFTRFGFLELLSIKATALQLGSTAKKLY